jgi:hypothetical protein
MHDHLWMVFSLSCSPLQDAQLSSLCSSGKRVSWLVFGLIHAQQKREKIRKKEERFANKRGNM